MFATATIVFREILEIALILGIVMAATRGLPGRINLALAGLLIGAIGSGVIAFFTESISQMVEGMGQEIFNAIIMFTAVIFLSWTVIWMKTHGRELAQNLKQVGQDVIAGDKSSYVLVGVIALATFREGAEIVLFSYGMLSAGAVTLPAYLTGALIGAAGGFIVGVMLYFGLLKVAQKHLFTTTAWLLILVTAGMAAHGANFLIAAGVLPTLHPELWDTSAILSGHSLMGETLGVLIGYTPRPTGMEFLFYVSVLLVVGGLYYFIGKQKPMTLKTANA